MRAVPDEANFHHLVFDIAWFGIALAATSRFLSVYAIRLGADATHLGLLVALPAILVLVSTQWGMAWRDRHQSSTQAVMLPAFLFRFVFLLPAFTPFLPKEWQPLFLIFSVALPALPQGLNSGIFISMMLESVHKERIPTLFSRRSMAMNAAIALGALGFGVWLNNAPFPVNYQVMFVAAFLLALISWWHVGQVRPLAELIAPTASSSGASPWQDKNFRGVIWLTTLAYTAYFTVLPLTPLWLMEEMGADEGFMTQFILMELASASIAAIVARRYLEKLGNHGLVAAGLGGTGLSLLNIVFAPSLPFTLISACLLGASWAAADLGMFNNFVQHTPTNSLKYSTAYTQLTMLAIFIGPILGSQLAETGISLFHVLIVGAIIRFGAGLGSMWLAPAEAH